MYVPLWAVVTLAYVVVMGWLLKRASADTGWFSGFGELVGMLLATVAYLLFWVIYLAVR